MLKCTKFCLILHRKNNYYTKTKKKGVFRKA